MSERKARKDAVDNRRMILQKAAELFAEHGIDGVTMHQIAKAAGIGQGTLYRHYAHKGDLCLDLMQDCSRRVQEELSQFLEEHTELPVRERLDMIFRGALDFTEEQSLFVGAVQAPVCEEGRAFFYRSALYEQTHSTICRLLEEAIEKEGIRPFDPVFAADAMLASFSPDLYWFLRRDRGYSKEQIHERFCTLYLEMLLVPGYAQ